MSVSFPNQSRNYCTFDESKVNLAVNKRDYQAIKSSLENPKNEEEILENLLVLNRLIDSGEKEEVKKLYPTLSKYNNTDSPNIQTFLSGIYRKTKVPDAFGPLCAMLIRNSINPPKDAGFDPNEEIGGAILDYLA